MCVLPRQTQSSVAAVLVFVLTTFAQDTAYAAEDAGHSPFGVIKREGFPAINRPGTAEHEALFAPPQEATTEAELSNMPADDVVFALPALPASQEVVAAPAIMVPSPPLIAPLFDAVVFGPPSPASQEVVAAPAIMVPSPPLIAPLFDAVVFGPPSAGADSDPGPERPAEPSSTPPSMTGARSVPAPPAKETTRLKARARELLAGGSVASARALLEDAASGGDAESEYLLAQTYDPQALTRSGVIGVAGDAGKADALYRAAQIGGYPRPDDSARASQP